MHKVRIFSTPRPFSACSGVGVSLQPLLLGRGINLHSIGFKAASGKEPYMGI